MTPVGPGIYAHAIRRPADAQPYALLLRVEGASGLSSAQTVLSRAETERLIADLTALLTETPVEARRLTEITGGRA